MVWNPLNTQKKATDDSTVSRGWRIQKIAPETEVSPRRAYGTAVLLIVAVLLLIAVLGFLVFPLADDAQDVTDFLRRFTPAHTFLTVLILVFVLPMGLGCVAYLRHLIRSERWLEVEATCLDRDIQPAVNIDSGGKERGWTYRLLCEYTRNGETYRVTPDGQDGRRFHLFDNPRDVQHYLNQHIGPQGKCRLRAHARSPRRVELISKDGQDNRPSP